MVQRVVLTIILAICIKGVAAAEDLCPVGVPSDKLICVIPQVYGLTGFIDDTGPFPANYLATTMRPFSSSIARQSALLPLASPSSGIVFSWDSEAKTFTSSADSFGPIFAERAETIVRYKLLLAFDYQYFKFKSIDGVRLDASIPAVFTQHDKTVQVGPLRVCSINGSETFGGSNTGPDCGYIRNVLLTNTQFRLRVRQSTTFITFGLTNRIDVSMAIPINNVELSVASKATIVENGPGNVHFFKPRPDCPAPCLNSSRSKAGKASGIGDITLRVKGTAWKGERSGVAIGVDVRTPTGDALNFLGAGTAGVKPFVAGSYHARVSPHFMVGYEVNGSSVIAGDISAGTKARLPGQLLYSGGTDVWITKWLTGAVDLVGQQVLQTQRVAIGTFTGPGKCDNSACLNPAADYRSPNLTTSTENINITQASFGLKIRPVSNLLLTGNALIKLNDAGLRADVIPLIGISYTF